MVRGNLKKNKSIKEVKDTIYLYVLQIVDKITPLLIIPYLLITLGAENYGYIGFATAIINYILLFVEFGFNLSATQRIAVAKERNTEELSRIFFSTMVAKVFLFFIASLIILPIVFFVPSLRIYFETVLFMFPLVLGGVFGLGWFYQGIGKIRIAAIVISLSKILVLPMIFVFVNEPSDYNLAAFIQSFVYLFSSIVTFAILYKMRVIKKTNVKLYDVNLEIKESFPLFLSSVATSMYTQLFTLILGFISTPTIVGKYSAAERIMRSICFAIYSPISQAFYPKIASLAYTNKTKAKDLFHKLVLFMFVLMTILSLSLFIFAKPIVNLLGNDYTGLEILLRIMSFVPIAIALGAIYGQMGLIAMGNNESKSKFKTVYFCAASFSLIAVSVLAFLYQDIGASIALLLTEYFVLFFMFRNYKRFSSCY